MSSGVFAPLYEEDTFPPSFKIEDLQLAFREGVWCRFVESIEKRIIIIRKTLCNTIGIMPSGPNYS